jgi:hypothetical protein
MFRQNCRVEESREENFVIAATKKNCSRPLAPQSALAVSRQGQLHPAYLSMTGMHAQMSRAIDNGARIGSHAKALRR